MKQALSILLLALVASGGEKAIVQFRLLKDDTAVWRGWILDYDDERFQFTRFGMNTKRFIPWDQLVPADALRLRRRFKLELSEDEKAGLVAGQRIHFHGGHVMEGQLVQIGADGRHWIRAKGLLLPYNSDRIQSVEEIKVKETDVYSTEEIYLRRLERTPPKSARQHRDLADHMFEIGRYERARTHYDEAIALNPQWRFELAGRLEDVDLYAQEGELGEALRRARKSARLDLDYKQAKQGLLDFLERNPDRKRAVLRAIEEVDQLRYDKLLERFHGVKNDEFRDAVRDYVVRRAPTIEEAMRWATAELPDQLEKAIRERMGLTKEEYLAFLKGKKGGAPHWASYWSGSFVMSKRAARGKSTKKTIRGNPDDWWDSYNQVGPRSNWIRAYAAERLPDLFEVVQVKTPDCEKCGGRGQTKHSSVHGLRSVGGKHEWNQRCARCFGARVDRVVAYR